MPNGSHEAADPPLDVTQHDIRALLHCYLHLAAAQRCWVDDKLRTLTVGSHPNIIDRRKQLHITSWFLQRK